MNSQKSAVVSGLSVIFKPISILTGFLWPYPACRSGQLLFVWRIASARIKEISLA
jgi:hypothetical protein